jgi:hypothetical protein
MAKKKKAKKVKRATKALGQAPENKSAIESALLPPTAPDAKRLRTVASVMS